MATELRMGIVGFKGMDGKKQRILEFAKQNNYPLNEDGTFPADFGDLRGLIDFKHALYAETKIVVVIGSCKVVR